MNTNKNINGKKLDGLTISATSGKPKLQLNPSKKHTRKHRGYIRGLEKANGKTYYYYCYTPRDRQGNYPEKTIYLGSAEKILSKFKNPEVQL
jgi:hypothetical protein